MCYAVSPSFRARVHFTSWGAIAGTALLPYFGALDQTFEGVWVP